jgi:hypothetical protein
MSKQLTEWRYAAMARYHSQQPAPTPGAVVSDTLEAVAREGARRMLQRALEVEVDVCDRYHPVAEQPRQRGEVLLCRWVVRDDDE